MNLLVCDDDISTLDVIEKQIDWSKLGIDQIYRAYNGQMAIDIIKEKAPELVLCDIGMPILRGTEVLKWIYDNKLNIEFTFLTCHEDFSYAKMAIQYNASDYVTKPFELNEIITCVQKMMANYRLKNKQAENKTKKSDDLMRFVFRQMTYGVLGKDEKTVTENMKQYDVDFASDSKWHIVFSCSDLGEVIKKAWSKDLLHLTCSYLHDEVLVDYYGRAYSVVDMDDRFIWTICFIPESVPMDELRSRCQKLIEFSEKYMSMNPVVIISDELKFYDSANVVASLFEKMRKARAYAGRVFMYNDNFEAYVVLDDQLNENRVFWHIKKRDTEGFVEYIKSIVDKTSGSKPALTQLKQGLLSIFMSNLKDNGISSNILYDNEKLMELEKRSVYSKNDFMVFAKELINCQITVLQSMLETDSIIDRALKYIGENYREDFDRDEVAAIAYITPNYFSKLFRNHMGMNLREYINRLRIEEAKRMMLSSNLSVSDIASYVGFYNISYFSTVFHKLVGQSPIEWRNGNHQEEQNGVKENNQG